MCNTASDADANSLLLQSFGGPRRAGVEVAVAGSDVIGADGYECRTEQRPFAL